MTQPSLFDALPEPGWRARGERHADARDTEAEAAELVARKVGRQSRAVLDALYRFGPLTDREIAELVGILHTSVNARRNALARDGWVRDSGLRRTTSFGTRNIVWALTDEAKRHLARPEVEVRVAGAYL